MKKTIAIMLALLLSLCCLGASAEAEMPFDGIWIQFEEGFQVCVPSDWLESEVTDEMLENGIFYQIASPDGAYTMQMRWFETDSTTIDELHSSLLPVYSDAQIIEINGIHFVAFNDTEYDVAGLAALDAEEGGMYVFYFTPASDEEFGTIAQAMIYSISNY